MGYRENDYYTLARLYSTDEEEAPVPDSPERELLRAFLRATLTDLISGGEHAEKARVYIEATGESHPLAFDSLCNLLDLDPGMVRRLAGVVGPKPGSDW